MQAVRVDAARTNRSLVASAPAERKELRFDPLLLLWRRLIEHAIADASKSHAGLPTDSAILARWWIEEHRPQQKDRAAWASSFEAACGWLQLDVDEERGRALTIIVDAQRKALEAYARRATTLRRAIVLHCAGASANGKKPSRGVRTGLQYELPLLASSDYEHVTGIEHPDPADAFSNFTPLNDRVN